MTPIAGERPTFPLEVVNEWREGLRSWDLFPEYDDPKFAPYRVGEFIYVRHYSIRVGMIAEIGHIDCEKHGEEDGKVAKYLVRLLQKDGTFAKRFLWATPHAIYRAYECTYDNKTGEKRTFPPFMIEPFLKELRKW